MVANGYGTQAREVFDGMFGGFRRYASHLAGGFDDLERMLTAISNLGDPSQLTRPQLERLDELASFLETIDFNNSVPWPESDADVRVAWYRLVATLGGLDLGILAAEATVLRTELDAVDDYGALFSLVGRQPPADLNRWYLVDQPDEAAALAVSMLELPRATPLVAGQVLAEHPNPDRVAPCILRVLPYLTREVVPAAVYAYLSLVDDEESAASLSCSEDESVRFAVARTCPLLDDCGVPTESG